MTFISVIPPQNRKVKLKKIPRLKVMTFFTFSILLFDFFVWLLCHLKNENFRTKGCCLFNSFPSLRSFCLCYVFLFAIFDCQRSIDWLFNNTNLNAVQFPHLLLQRVLLPFSLFSVFPLKRDENSLFFFLVVLRKKRVFVILTQSAPLEYVYQAMYLIQNVQ